MTTLTHTRRLRRQIEWVLPEMTTAVSQLILHPRFRELYPEFLIVVHQMIRATVPLMRTALARCRELEETDPVAALMAPYFEQHIREEMHHDDWLLEDLEFLGIPRAEVWQRMPSSAVASLIGGHYYWIRHHHPVAKLGQIAVMEGYPGTVEFIDLLQSHTGHPRPAFRTLEKHCHLDTNHRDDFDTMLDRLPLTEEHHAILEASALHTVRQAAKAYRELLDHPAGRTGDAGSIPQRKPHLLVQRIGDGDYRVGDPLRNTVYRVGEQEYFLLTQCDGRGSRGSVRRAYGERFGEPLSEEELDEFVRLAADEQMIAAADGPGWNGDGAAK